MAMVDVCSFGCDTYIGAHTIWRSIMPTASFRVVGHDVVFRWWWMRCIALYLVEDFCIARSTVMGRFEGLK